jgi:SRSO17 transposase
LCACQTQVKNTKEYGKTLSAARKRLESYLSDYQCFFRNKTKKFFDKARQYTKGILVSHLRNIEQINDTLGTTDYFQLQHFITESNWNERDVLDMTAKLTSETLPKRKLTGLIIDETGTVKKGDKSVGVGWQYCGNVGKTANSQVCVMACLSNGDHASLVDARLYLPQDWSDDPNRCKEAGIPGANRVFKTKLELAYDILLHQLELGTVFEFVSADGYYGNDLNFGSKINDLGLVYMLDIHRDQPIYLEKPELFLPQRKSPRGREPKRLKTSVQSLKVSEYCKSLQANEWQKIKVRNTAKGTLTSLYHFVKVFVWNKETDDIENRLLVIRKTKTKSGEEIKYSFTNAEMAQYTEKAIAYMQAQRYFIEHCIRESKQVLGLSQFQTRKWSAWQHQVALNMMTMCFMLKERLCCFAQIPLLSARDIREWLCFAFARKLTEQDILKLIISRHYRRQTDINRAYIKEYLNLSK